MSAIKKFFGMFSNKVETAIENSMSASDRNRQAARLLIKEIDKLKHAEVEAVRELIGVTDTALKHEKLHKKKDAEIRALLNADQVVPDAMYVLSVQHRNISEAMTARAEKMKASIDKVPDGVAKLDAKLQEVRLNQEVFDLAQQSKELGIEMPEDIQASIDHTLVSVDTLYREISVYNSKENTASVTPIDVQVYKAELAKK